MSPLFVINSNTYIYNKKIYTGKTMAEDINIQSVGGKDPIEDMPWARDQTLKNIAKLLKSLNTGNASATRNLMEYFENGETNQRQGTEAIRDLGRDFKKNKPEALVKRMSKDIQAHLGVQRQEKDDGSMDILATITATFIESMKAIVINFGNMYESGVVLNKNTKNFDGTVTALKDNLLATGMSLTTFSTLMQENALTVNTMGVDSFFNLSKEIKRYSDVSKGYSMTIQQSGKFAMEYLEQQRNMLNFDTFKEQAQRKSMAETISDSRKFASALGMSVEAFMALKTTQSESMDVNRALINVGKGSKDAYLQINSVLQKTAPDMANLFNTMLASPELAEQELAQMAATWGTEGTEAVRKLYQDLNNPDIAMSSEEFAERLQEASASGREYQLANKETIGIQAKLGNLGAKAAQENIIGLERFAEAYKNAAVDQKSELTGLTKVWSDFKEKFNKIIEKTILPMFENGKLAGAMETFVKLIEQVAGTVMSTVSNLLDPDKIGDTFGNVGDFFEDIPSMVDDVRGTMLSFRRFLALGEMALSSSWFSDVGDEDKAKNELAVINQEIKDLNAAKRTDLVKKIDSAKERYMSQTQEMASGDRAYTDNAKSKQTPAERKASREGWEDQMAVKDGKEPTVAALNKILEEIRMGNRNTKRVANAVRNEGK